MPSPVGHILGGATVYLAGKRADSHSRLILVTTLVGSVLPDLDFLPGFVIGNLGAFHHGVSHSVAFAVLFGMLVCFLFRWRHQDVALRGGVLATLSYASHIALDFAAVNEGTRGVPIIWPLSDQQFGLNFPMLGYFQYSNSIWSVFRWDNVHALTREFTILGIPVLFLITREMRKRRRLNDGKLSSTR